MSGVVNFAILGIVQAIQKAIGSLSGEPIPPVGGTSEFVNGFPTKIDVGSAVLLKSGSVITNEADYDAALWRDNKAAIPTLNSPSKPSYGNATPQTIATDDAGTLTGVTRV